MEFILESIIRIKPSQPTYILVGNMCDKTKREVSYPEGEKLAKRLGCDYMETSAKTSQNVQRLFVHLIRMLRQNEIGSSEVPSPPKGKKRHCVIV